MHTFIKLLELEIKNNNNLKELFETEYLKRNNSLELSLDKPDPLLVACMQKNQYAILLCALYGYGNAKQIVKFLSSLDFSLLDSNEKEIKRSLKNRYYRFQNNDDVIQSFISLSRISQEFDLEELFFQGYKKEHNMIDGIDSFLDTLLGVNKYQSYGYNFLFSKKVKRDAKNKILYKQNSPYKRYNMFFRWMIRKDNLDLGLWKKFNPVDLILPLDTHTYKISKKIGLLEKGSYNLESAYKITQKLKLFDKKDPIKYDFALYRIGQEKIV